MRSSAQAARTADDIRCRRTRRLVALCLLLARAPSPVAAADTVLDDFEELKGWTSSTSQGASLEIAHDSGHTGMSMRLDFDFRGGGGYVIARKTFTVSLPANYALSLHLRGDAPQNDIEFKLIDPQGNVWWTKQRDFIFPSDWQQLILKKARFDFAWGPSGGGTPKRVAAIEFAISASAGGKGSVWLDNLGIERREAAPAEARPKVRASTFVAGHEPELILDKKTETSWRSGSLGPNQWVLIDFSRRREYGGLVIDWDREDYATRYQVQVSDDGESWTPAYSSSGGNGGRDYVSLHDGESRFLRVDLQESSRGQGYGIRTLVVKPYAFSASPNQFFEAVAADSPVGSYPKYFAGRQTYWTVIGLNGDEKEALLNEEGMLEVDKGAFSIEPFVYFDGRLINWSGVYTEQELERGDLPIPSVIWRHDDVTLRVTALASGRPGASAAYARYRLENRSDAARELLLFLVLRPFQVVPPWQSLNMTGGVAPIRDIAFDSRTVLVNRERAVISLTPPDRFGAASFQEGSPIDFLQDGKLPPHDRVTDEFGSASGVLQYRFRIEPGAGEEVYLAVPFHDAGAVAQAVAGGESPAALFQAQFDAATGYWTRLLDRVVLELPPDEEHIARTLKTTLAYILINRDGPALQPGPRTYARSWIRDGAFSSTALLGMGLTEEAREFIRWFGAYQSREGRVPCCVDRRGADPVPEHDSNGQLIYTINEYYRFTRDVGFLTEMWPTVVRATDFIAALREQRTTDAYRQADKLPYFGLLPESISHEGYSAHPVHSYWDDFCALRGLKDAAYLAGVLGDDEHAMRYAALRDAFRHDLYASIDRAMAMHKIDFIPGSVELGDYDATSTAIAVSLAGELGNLPQPALNRTFDLYYQHVQERSQRAIGDDGYTPYELRNVEALILMGQRDRAFEILELLLDDQRPTNWNEWQEVVWRNPNAPRFIGDMPHTWIGATFIRSVRSMFAYELETTQSLVLAAGLPAGWIVGGPGVAIRRLPTHYGVLTYELRHEEPNRLRLRLSGDLSVPPGGVVIQPPLPRPIKAVTVNGEAIATFSGDRATFYAFPAEVVIEY
jgi:hypothetical protein